MKKTQKRLGNKGFSLVELIVVIAIMAVLIAVIAPTLISKIEDSREATDLETLGEVRNQIVNALADDDIYKNIVQKDAVTVLTIDGSLTITPNPASISVTDLKDELDEVLEEFEWKSKACGKNKITVRISSKGKVYAFVDDGKGTPVKGNDVAEFEAGNEIKADAAE